MLTVDLRLPDFEVRKIVREKCAKFGTVKQIRIVGDVDQDGQRYAFVEMSSRAATQSVGLQVGDSPVRECDRDSTSAREDGPARQSATDRRLTSSTRRTFGHLQQFAATHSVVCNRVRAWNVPDWRPARSSQSRTCALPLFLASRFAPTGNQNVRHRPGSCHQRLSGQRGHTAL